MSRKQIVIDDSNIQILDLKEAMKSYYMDYAMSVIVGRALPDVRDGFKPVHRRILFAMEGLKLYFEGKYKKSARTVGEVLGKYHPHGDSSVYDALVRMAQPFSLRYPLVDGHGNFGNEDGDSAAAMRYTESKMSKIAKEMLRDINKNTVDMIPNFDGEEKEPRLLPSRFPNLLANGSSGIAVGFATNIPPHNLIDTIEQIIYQIDNPNCTIKELVDIMKAPDFPTGGIIVNPQNMINVYTNGTGNITIRSKYHIEDGTKIIFTEIPYGVNKLKLMDSLVMLKDGYYKKEKEGKGKKLKEVFVNPVIPQMVNVFDLSDGVDGISIEIDVDKEENVDLVLKLLFENSKLQDNFSANFTAVQDDNLLEKMSLKVINNYYIEFQKEVVSRRTIFLLEKAKEKLNKLEGYIKVLDDIDKAIATIRGSKNGKHAKANLMVLFELNMEQAESILAMKLERLTGLEIEYIKTNYEKTLLSIDELNKILSNDTELLNVIKQELNVIKETYGDARRTEILHNDTLAHIDVKNVEIEDYNCRILLTNSFIKKHLKQSPNHKIKDGEEILCDITSTNKSTLLVFTDKGNRYKIDCSALGTFTPSGWGDSISRTFKDMDKDEKPIKVISVEEPKGYMLFVYENGKVSKINIDKYMSIRKVTKNCFNLESKLIAMEYIKSDVDILSVSYEGKGLIVNSYQIGAKDTTSSKGNNVMKGNVSFAIIGATPSNVIEFTTEKSKVKVVPLGDRVKEGEERTWYEYISGSCGNKGSYLYNIKNDVITSIKEIK